VTQERWTETSGLRIRYLDNDPADPVGIPIVFSPGIADDAGDYDAMLSYFSPRRVIAVDVRGRGGSDAPPVGYTVDLLADDLGAAIDAAGIERFHLMTFSRGTPTALTIAFRDPTRVASIAIGDYRAVEIQLNTAFVDHQWSSTWRGRPMPQLIPRHALEEIARDSRPRQLRDELGALGLPVLVARGDQPGCLVDDAAVGQYRLSVPGVEIVVIPGASHDLFRPERLGYPKAVTEFIGRRVENASSVESSSSGPTGVPGS
jgi:pimeloyl-ACP methyl ester carboxylesterase